MTARLELPVWMGEHAETAEKRPMFSRAERGTGAAIIVTVTILLWWVADLRLDNLVEVYAR